MLNKWILKWDKIFFKFFDEIFNIKSHYFFIVIAIIAILPLVFLSFFNNPGSDDFDFAYESQVESFFSLQTRRYFEWSGRYFSNGLISVLNPLIYNNYYWFKIIPILILLLFVFSISAFFSSLILGTTRLEKYSFVGLFLFVYLYQMPSVCGGFYWIPGSFTYQLPQVLTLLFFSSLFKYFQGNNGIYLLLSSLFLFSAMGCNEITVVSLLFIIFILFFYNLWVLRKFNKALFFILILAICFALLEVLAPGNSIRAEHFKFKHQVIHSLLKSFQISLSLIMKWIPIITICCFFFLKTITQFINEKIDKKYILHPFFSFCIFFLIVYIGVFPCFWSANGRPPGRAENTIYFFFIFAYLNFIFSVVYHFVIIKKYDLSYQINVKICIGIIIFLSLFSDNNITSAYHDLLTGKAYKYNDEMVARFKLIKNCKEQECVLPSLNNAPQSIYISEVMGLTNDKNNWKNKEIARYFRKKSIIIQPIDSLLTE